MKKTLSALFAALLAASSLLLPSCSSSDGQGEDFSDAVDSVTVSDPSYYEKFRDQGLSINVYNWGEYISNGSEGSLDVIAAFENLSGIKVNYTNYATNEDMYAKFKAGSGSVYDIVIPSDYMIAKMIKEDMLEKPNFDNIPNIANIDDQYRYPDFDPTGEYTVPYTWGTVGIVYNTKHVTAEEASTWDVLWNEKFSGEILMFSNSRDAFAIALAKLGYSMNTDNLGEIREAAEALQEQKQYVQTYVMDQIFDKMQLEEAYVAPYYAGDAMTMIRRNPDLAFAFPKESCNIFIDSICIPKGSKNKEAAEAFINFLCEDEVAAANCEYICYSTPSSSAKELLPNDMKNSEIAYPSAETLERFESFIDLPTEANEFMIRSWNDILVGTNEDNWQSGALTTVAIIVGLALIILIILMRVRKKRKNINY